MHTSDQLTWRFHVGLGAVVVAAIVVAVFVMVSTGSRSPGPHADQSPSAGGTSGAAVADATLAGAGDHDIPALPEPLQLEVATGPKTPQADATMTPDTAGPGSATDVATSAAAVSTEPTEVEPPTDPGGAVDAAAIEAAPRSNGNWWYGPVTVKTGVFLVEPGMLGSGGRYLHAAPIGQRYVFVSVVLTWEGEQTREIRFRSDGGTSASIQLGVLDERIDPVGRVVPDPGPLRPVATDSMVLEPGARSAFEVVFALPEAVVEANLLVDGRVHQSLTIPGDAPSPPSTWVGTWRRGAETIGPMRYGRPLLDALVGSDARVMKIQQRLDGLTVVSVPSASISSDGEVDTRNERSIDIHLVKGDLREAATLRAIRGGAALLLYVGSDRSVVLLYERRARS